MTTEDRYRSRLEFHAGFQSSVNGQSKAGLQLASRSPEQPSTNHTFRNVWELHEAHKKPNKEDEMWVSLKLPEIGSEPLGEPHCPYCKSTTTKIYERTTKKVKHPNLSSVSVVRRRCECCRRTFRHYAPGVGKSVQTDTVKALSALLYSIGLSYEQIVDLHRDLGVKLVKSTVWKSVKPVNGKACKLHAQSLKGQVKVMGMPANSLKRKRGEALAPLRANLLDGKPLEVEFPDTEEGRALALTLVTMLTDRMHFTVKTKESVKSKRNEFTNPQRNACMNRLDRSVKRNCTRFTQEAENLITKARRKEKERLQKLLDDCRIILNVVESRDNSCERRFWAIYKRYASAKAPSKGDKATLWYKMRLFTLSLWDRSSRVLEQLAQSGAPKELRTHRRY